MGKVQFYSTMGATQGAYEYLGEIFDDDSLEIVSKSKTKVVIEDQYGNQLVVLGKNFKFHDGIPTSGTVTGATFFNSHHKKLVEASGVSFAPLPLMEALAGDGVAGFLDELTSRKDTLIGSSKDDALGSGAGDDIIKGMAGNDMLGGGQGKDVLTGGAGMDRFLFVKGFGRDTVTDFDADGGGRKQDYIATQASLFSSVKIKDMGKDVDIDFGGNDHLILKNVDHKHITADDFYLF